MTEPLGTGSTPRDRRNVTRYIGLNALWGLVFIISTAVLGSESVEPGPLRWVIAFMPSVFAAFSARAYWRYVKGMDELLRVIELKALALSVIAGFIAWPAVFLVNVGMPMDINVPVVLLIMTGFYVFGLVRGRLAHL